MCETLFTDLPSFLFTLWLLLWPPVLSHFPKWMARAFPCLMVSMPLMINVIFCSSTPSGNVKNDDADADAKSLCVSSDTLNFIQSLCKTCILLCFLFCVLATVAELSFPHRAVHYIYTSCDHCCHLMFHSEIHCKTQSHITVRETRLKCLIKIKIYK